MGRQIGFYMDEDDGAEFFEFVKTTGHIEVLRPFTNSPEEPLDFPRRSPGFAMYQVYCYNRDVPGELRFSEADERRGLYHLDRGSPVIEFDATGLRPLQKVMFSGRLWADFRRWFPEDQVPVPKAP
jgi:hypothetical protein